MRPFGDTLHNSGYRQRMTQAQNTNGTPRRHIVLVPGFAGFDALGTIRYYTGTTAEFRAWQETAPEETSPDGPTKTQGKRAPAARKTAVLHYFDNLPTSAVARRADRLRGYLARRIARNEFQHGDEIALVGHSTGGLDIRRLIVDLEKDPGYPNEVDADGGRPVTNEEVLSAIKRLVFLSVPQGGTHIAYVIAHERHLSRFVTDLLGRAFESVHARPVRSLARLWLEGDWSYVGLFTAMADALRESDEALYGRKKLVEKASAREAYAGLSLWSSHIKADFEAIYDLEGVYTKYTKFAYGLPDQYPFYAPDVRAKEAQIWDRKGIETLSFATIGRDPKAPQDLFKTVWNLLRLGKHPRYAREQGPTRENPVYDFCYLACAIQQHPYCAPAGDATPFLGGPVRHIKASENDAIVNTASMLWPNGDKTWLIDGDHGDIVGHFEPVLDSKYAGTGRRYSAYDIFESRSGFNKERFKKVWQEVFSFCMT
jgi:triacylglycerol lipase